ncbi:DMT family transporter [Aureimonas mangrovi]|uniref:DMT family transporter n=1 Tax=Aureimonas mangrovi TaxID=2758041 RepID=UPI00163D5376|nr:DMT family transporter [Aureimonas mangrovi]
MKTNLIAGIATTVFAGLLFASMDATGKYTTTLVPVLTVIWGRYVFHTLIVTAVLARTTGTRFLKTRQPFLQVARGLSLLVTTGFMYSAISRVPLADATAVAFFAPILVTILSVIFLKEKIGIHRISAILIGFAGVLLIVRPGSGSLDPALLLALCAALSNAVYLLLTRRLAGVDDAASTQFNTTAVGAVILSVVIIPFWQTPTWNAFLLMALMGAFGAFGHSILVRAFAIAPASLLSPFLYSQVLFAGILSVAVLGDPLHPAMVAGTVLLIASGLYIWWRENKLGLPTAGENTVPPAPQD